MRKTPLFSEVTQFEAYFLNEGGIFSMRLKSLSVNKCSRHWNALEAVGLCRILPSTKQAFCLNLQIWQCGELQAPAFPFPFNLVHIALIGRPPVRWVQNAGVRFVEPLKLRLWRRQFVTMDRRRKFRTLFIVDVLYLCFLRHRRGLLFILYGQFWPSRYLCT